MVYWWFTIVQSVEKNVTKQTKLKLVCIITSWLRNKKVYSFSHNHGSVENGHIWKVTILAEGAIFHWTMTMGGSVPSNLESEAMVERVIQTLQTSDVFALPSKVSTRKKTKTNLTGWQVPYVHEEIQYIFMVDVPAGHVRFRVSVTWKNVSKDISTPKSRTIWGFSKNAGFPQQTYGVFLLKMIITWGVKWGKNPPVKETPIIKATKLRRYDYWMSRAGLCDVEVKPPFCTESVHPLPGKSFF